MNFVPIQRDFERAGQEFGRQVGNVQSFIAGRFLGQAATVVQPKTVPPTPLPRPVPEPTRRQVSPQEQRLKQLRSVGNKVPLPVPPESKPIIPKPLPQKPLPTPQEQLVQKLKQVGQRATQVIPQTMTKKTGGQKGALSFAILFVLMFTFLVLFLAIVSPALERIAIEQYAIGDQLLEDTNASIQSISDTGVRNSFNNAIAAQRAAATSNVDIISLIATYGWIVIIIGLFLIVFLAVRENVEVQIR